MKCAIADDKGVFCLFLGQSGLESFPSLGFRIDGRDYYVGVENLIMACQGTDALIILPIYACALRLTTTLKGLNKNIVGIPFLLSTYAIFDKEQRRIGRFRSHQGLIPKVASKEKEGVQQANTGVASGVAGSVFSKIGYLKVHFSWGIWAVDSLLVVTAFLLIIMSPTIYGTTLGWYFK